ncbi:fluoride efflux transporter CrcB [Sphingomonas koreensis]|jgi:CrcB protein|uniref:Fluoride-specific ion channel FluC n=1 Tax=Sphingomonas koreensis TaxID=93064 RepID=A0A1L6J9T1_9SPHN|nr:fluoride efflux transporter CrcB [Sphingomonas koreensis]APR52654.1 camphor resistance protein CrcB [Sphingomonas koreensis]MDC7812514.1 fluoride efflux transporter CrcB [Sphingomonas koreensis]RSU18319.1 fluoride efflux transporter CrcB [Sphingomonas koreensis]RSU28523.1 fluoride efflux transporter CrcB [Sphingomonas koreensis]RSU31157.1 fluoride efflux transporter CrcB [Sphingomonas koreensis]
MNHLFLVMLGGAIGAGARHLTGRAALALWGPGFPWGTLVVNLLGGMLMGLLAGWLAARASGDEALRYLLGVGLLGGYTTFSAFSLETATMLQRGDHGVALLYILASVAGSILALFAGLQIARVAA